MDDQTAATPAERPGVELAAAREALCRGYRQVGSALGHLRAAARECHRLGETDLYEQIMALRRHMRQIRGETSSGVDDIDVARLYAHAIPADRDYIRDDDGEPMSGSQFQAAATALVAALADRLTPSDHEMLTCDTRDGGDIQEPNIFLANLVAALAGHRPPITVDERNTVVRLIARRAAIDRACIRSFNVVDPAPAAANTTDADGRDDHPPAG